MSFLSNMKVFENELLTALDQIASNNSGYNKDTLKSSFEKLTSVMVNDNQTHTIQNGFVKKSLEKLEGKLDNTSSEVPGLLVTFDNSNNLIDVPLSNSYKTYIKADVILDTDAPTIDVVSADPTINFTGVDIPLPKDGEFTTRKFTVEMRRFKNNAILRPRFNNFTVNGHIVNVNSESNNNNNGMSQDGKFNVVELSAGSGGGPTDGAYYQNFILRRNPDGYYDVTSTVYFDGI